MRLVHTWAALLRKRLSPGHVALLERVSSLAGSRGEKVVLVGGSTRDLLLGRDVDELDLAIEGDAAGLAAQLAREFGGTPRVHGRFATARIDVAGGISADIATARRETYPSPAALPVIAPGTIEEDLGRRDFTINTLAMRLDPACFGVLLDPFGGVRDLRRGLVRVLHDRSFSDDPTRALRAVRLAARLGFSLEGRTRGLMEQAIHEGAFDLLSGDRLRRELDLLMDEMPLRLAAQNLSRNGLLPAVADCLLLDAAAAGRLETLDEFLSREQNRRTGGSPVRRLLLFLGVLAWDRPEARRAALARRLGLSGESLRLLASMPGRAAALGAAIRACGGVRSGVFFALEKAAVEEVIGAVAADAAAGPHVATYLDELAGARPLIGGEELVGLGIGPGPAHGRVLRSILAARLDGQVSTREEEMALARRLIESGPRS